MSPHRASINLSEKNNHASAIFPDSELYSLSYSVSKFFLPPGGDVMLGREVRYARKFHSILFEKHPYKIIKNEA